MKRVIAFLPLLLSAQQIDYNRQVMNKPTLSTINGGTLPPAGAITKIDGAGHLAPAVAGSDYAAPGSFTLPFLRATTDCGLAMNGSTDDTTALSSCINALPSTGGTIVFPVGTSMIANLVITKNNVHLVGQGQRHPWSSDVGSTQLRYPSSASAGGFILKFAGSGGYTQLNSSVENMTLEANFRAATGLWLWDAFQFTANRITVANNTGGYAIIFEGSGITTTPRCGDGTGSVFLENYIIWTGANAGGLHLGANGKDVCSIKAGKGSIHSDLHPPYHGIYAQYLDSSSFADTTVSDLGNLTTTSTSCSSNVCTITTSTPHNLKSPQQGVFIRSIATPQLRGSFPATPTGTYTFTIPVEIANGSYTVWSVQSSSVELGTPACQSTALSCAWDNVFGNLLTAAGMYEWPNYGVTASWNLVSQWNWIETTGGDTSYASPGIINSVDLLGGYWNMKIMNSVVANFPKPQLYGIRFGASSIRDSGTGIDFTLASPVTPGIGYYPLKLYNNTYIGTRNASGSADIVLIGADSSNNINIGSPNNPAGTRIVFNDSLQLGSLTAPTCNSATRGTFNYTASGAGVKDSVQVCAKDAGDSFGWRTVY